MATKAKPKLIVKMRCVLCQTLYEIDAEKQGSEHPMCPLDFMPLATESAQVKSVKS